VFGFIQFSSAAPFDYCVPDRRSVWQSFGWRVVACLELHREDHADGDEAFCPIRPWPAEAGDFRKSSELQWVPDDSPRCGCFRSAFGLLSVVGGRCWPSLVAVLDPPVFGFIQFAVCASPVGRNFWFRFQSAPRGGGGRVGLCRL